MPLMQLSTLVLPAPFGPMSANSSPGTAVNDTRSSTVRPPKRSDRRSSASSAIPSPAAAILLDIAIGAARARNLSQIELLHVGMGTQPFSAAVEHNAAILHHIGVIGDVEREGGTLLHQQDGERELAPDLHQPAHEVF